MKRSEISAVLIMSVGLLLCTAQLSRAAPLGTAFAYQGRLVDSNNPADGLYDFEFKLFNDPCTGGQLGSTISINDLDVIEGYFTVELDFGGVFDGDARWLEIAVRPGDSNGSFDILMPRQELTPTPYSIYAENAGTDNDWMVSGYNIYSIPPGSVGIGTTSPSSKLHIKDNTAGDLILKIHNQNDAGSERLYFGTSNSTDAGIIVWGPSNPTYPGKWRFFNNKASGHYDWLTNLGTMMTLTNDGKLGIGTTSPSHPLHVTNSSNATSSKAIYGLASPATAGQQISGVFGETNNTATTDSGAGVTGYASSSTGSSAGVQGEAAGSTGKGVYAMATHAAGTNYGLYAHTNSSNGYAGYFTGGRSYFEGRVGIGYSNPYAKLFVQESGFDDPFQVRVAGSTKLIVKNDGMVGIGTNLPAAKLTVRGNILIQKESDGTSVMELGEGLDYAEGFDVSESTRIHSGSVLIIDAKNPGKLTLSNKPYDSKVAGIVAGAKDLSSGVRLGAGQFDYDVALAGRVYCNVDATENGVEPGDLLTTSATPGYAMKAANYKRAKGAILGKAMESLEKGQKGQILVLVTLQ